MNYPTDEIEILDSWVNLECYLDYLKDKEFILEVVRNGTEYRVRTSRYIIMMKVLHTGHVARYTINNETGKVSNRGKAINLISVRDNIDMINDLSI